MAILSFLTSLEIELKTHHVFYFILLLAIGSFLYTVYGENIASPSIDLSSKSYLGSLNFLEQIEDQMSVAFEEFTKNELFQQLGTLLTFLYGMTPSVIPVPNEIFMSAVILAQDTIQDQIDNAVFLILLTSIAGFIGDSLVFFGAKYHLHKLFGHEQKDDLEESHMFNRYGVAVFLFSPSFWFAGGLAELPLLYAGYIQTSYQKMAPFLFVGNLIRGIWGGIILLSMLNLLQI